MKVAKVAKQAQTAASGNTPASAGRSASLSALTRPSAALPVVVRGSTSLPGLIRSPAVVSVSLGNSAAPLVPDGSLTPGPVLTGGVAALRDAPGGHTALSNEIINTICDLVIKALPRDVNEIIGRPQAKAAITDISVPYQVDPANLKTHELMNIYPFREAFIAKHYWERTFSCEISRPDPSLTTFKGYLTSFGGCLPFVRVLSLDVAVVLGQPGDPTAVEGRVRITLVTGVMRVTASRKLQIYLPGGLNARDHVRQISLPWTNMLRAQIKEQQDELQRGVAQIKTDWIGIREVSSSFLWRN